MRTARRPVLCKVRKGRGTAHSSSKCNKFSNCVIRNKHNAWSEIGGNALNWSMEKLESRGRFPLCPQTRLLLLPPSHEDPEESRSRDL
jgi:hypothetical protein